MNRRLTEYSLDRITAETDGALAGEPASAALADSFSNRFSLFDDTDAGTANSLTAVFVGSDLDERIATAAVDAYRHYRDLHANYVDECRSVLEERYSTPSRRQSSHYRPSPRELDVVVLSGYHEVRPVERRLIERLVDELPMIALLPLYQGGRREVDTVTQDTLEVYEALDFKTVELEPVDD